MRAREYGSGVAYALLTFLIVALVGGGVWAFRVATSDVKGQGDATIRKNSGVNRVAAQERAVALFEEVKRADRVLDVHAAAAKANPADQVIATRYSGSVSYCLTVVADYNAHTQKYLSREFIPAELPVSINPADPATDCKESM